MDWWQDVLDRTSWLELVAAFVSVVAAVWLAVRSQSKDFDRRNEETNAATLAMETERRHSILARALDALESTLVFALEDKELRPLSAEHVALRAKISNASALIQVGGQARDVVVGSWFELELLRFIDSPRVPRGYDVKFPVFVSLRSNRIRANMIGWFDGTADPDTWDAY